MFWIVLGILLLHAFVFLLVVIPPGKGELPENKSYMKRRSFDE